MADEQKPGATPPGGDKKPEGSNISPAPTDFDDDKNKKDAGGDKPKPTSMPAEPLSDGTVPTVLTPGQTHHSVTKGKTSLNTIYRKADVLTSVLTFGIAVVASALVIGGYIFFTGGQKKATPPPKVTSLNSSDLKSLNDFFNGNSSGTGSGQVITISSPTEFTQRVGVASDLAVTGGLSVTGPTALGTLTVDQQTNLGVTDVRGSLVVSGPVNLQSPTTLGGGGTVTGNLAVSGNGSFGGSVSAGVINVANLSVSGTLSLDGHLSIGGHSPSASSPIGTATVQGDDSAGSVSVSATSSTHTNPLVTINFSSGYQSVPIVIITPIGQSSAQLEPYVEATANNFSINAATGSIIAGSYAFNFWVVQY